MDKQLQDKVAIVTGSTSGIGQATAELFAKRGAKVVVVGRDQAKADTQAKKIIDEGGEAIGIQADVAKTADIEAMIDKTIKHFGKLDILMNNAGVMDKNEPVENVTEDEWQRIMNINVTGVLMASKRAIQAFKDQKSAGVIINVASVGGLHGARAGVMYTASKHAVVGITKNIAYFYAQEGIRCNAIAPGGVNTNIMEGLMDKLDQFGSSRTAAGMSSMTRMGEPSEIAEAALFLASDAASFVNGEVLVVDGGWTAY